MIRKVTYRILIAGILLLPLTLVAQRKKDKKGKPGFNEQKEMLFNAYFTDGNKYYILENFSKAIENFKKALELNPNSASANYKIAETYVVMNKLDDALPYAEKAVSLEEQNKYYYLLLSEIYQKQNKLDDAAKVLQKLVKQYPNSIDDLMELTGIYLYQNKFDDALKTLDKLEKVWGYTEELSIEKQKIFLRQNKLNEAIAEAKKLCETYPDNYGYEANLAQIYFSNNKPEEAQKTAESVLKKDPNHPQAHLILSDIYKSRKDDAKYKYHMREAFKNPDLPIDGKIAILISYVRMLPNPEMYPFTVELAITTTEVHPTEAKAFAMLGDIYTIGVEKIKARDAYLKTCKLDNSEFKVWQQIVFLDSELDDNKSLAEHSGQALEIFPNQSIFWYFNGIANYMLKNHKEAAEALEQGKKLTTDNLEMTLQFYTLLGDVYNSLKEYNKSSEAYEFVLSKDSSNAHVLNNYSYYLSLRNENLEKAKSMSFKLIKRYPDNSTYLDTYAWVLYKLQEYDNAAKYMEMALMGSASGTLLEHYGDILFKKGDKEKAIEQWKKAKTAGGASDLLDKKIAEQKLYE